MGTGPWHDVEELYTIINVIAETDELDAIIDFDFGGAAEVMSPLVDIANDIKNEINTACKNASEEMADRQRSLQELALAVHGNIAKGQLISNIIYKAANDVGENAFIVGPNVPHFYPLCIEFGRGPVYPINYPFLHWFTLSGKEIYSKYSKPVEPSPFVEPSFEEIVSEAEDIIRRQFG